MLIFLYVDQLMLEKLKWIFIGARALGGALGAFKIYITLTLLLFGCKCTTYVGIARGRSAGNEIIAEFTLLGFLDV
jgi:hypothetical protein